MNYIKTTITLILLSSTVLVLSQENNRKKTRIGFYFAPSYTYRILSSKSQEEIYHYSYMRYRDVTESPSKSKAEYNRRIPFDYKFGMSVDYSISNTLSLESGIVYEKYSYERFASAIWKYGDINEDDELFNFEYSFISLPTIINYKIEKRKLLLTGGAGLIQSVLIDKKEDIDNNPLWGEVISTEANTYNISPVVKFGLDYKISKSISIFCEPQFSIMLFPFKTENVISTYFNNQSDIEQVLEGTIKERLYSFGISIGFRV